SACRAAGVEVGDIVLKVDGEAVATRMARYSKWIPDSTEAAHRLKVARRMLFGAEGSILTLTVRDKENRVKDITLPRKSEYLRSVTRRKGEIVRVLDRGIGYVDLERLSIDQVNEMFEKLRGTSATIFDLRGYPQGTVWSIAPRVNKKGARFGALYRYR